MQLIVFRKIFCFSFFALLISSKMNAYQNPFLDNAATQYADSMAKIVIAEISLKEKITMLAGDKYFKLKTGLPFIFKGHLVNAIIQKK